MSDKLLEAKERLSEKLFRDFSIATGGPVNGVGMNRKENALRVYVSREPNTAEAAKLPQEFEGFSVKYINSPSAIAAPAQGAP